MNDTGTQMEQLELIYSTAPMGIALLNEQLEFVSCNPGLLRKLDFTMEEMSTKTLMEVCHPWDRNKLQKVITAAIDQRSEYLREEVRFSHKHDSFLWVEISIQYIPENEVHSSNFVVMVQNIQKRKEMQIELIELRRKMLEQVEIERKLIAQELHDGHMQDLHSITYQIAGMDDLPEDVHAKLDAILNTVKQINTELRAIAYNLRPPALSQFGLARSIKSHTDEFLTKYPDLHIHLELVTDRNVISEEVNLVLFRIYQQALGNVIQHANATEVKVTLNLDGDAVTLEIMDNGSGFDVPDRWISLVRAGHYGLAGSSDRVDALGGEFKVVSARGEGTKVFVRIPDYMEA
ncbi:MAG: PAS domain-containing sensor histidine kinase [Anaerolineales bacterium]